MDDGNIEMVKGITELGILTTAWLAPKAILLSNITLRLGSSAHNLLRND